MGVDELLERSTISFPRPLAASRIEDLFRHIQKNLNCEIRYSVNEHKSMGSTVEQREHWDIETVAIELSGRINTPMYSASFSCDSELEESPTHITGIRFSTIPGYDLEQHNKNEIQIWDDVRESVKSYFLQNFPKRDLQPPSIPY